MDIVQRWSKTTINATTKISIGRAIKRERERKSHWAMRQPIWNTQIKLHKVIIICRSGALPEHGEQLVSCTKRTFFINYPNVDGMKEMKLSWVGLESSYYYSSFLALFVNFRIFKTITFETRTASALFSPFLMLWISCFFIFCAVSAVCRVCMCVCVWVREPNLPYRLEITFLPLGIFLIGCIIPQHPRLYSTLGQFWFFVPLALSLFVGIV